MPRAEASIITRAPRAHVAQLYRDYQSWPRAACHAQALVQADAPTYRDVWGGRWVAVDLTRVTRAELGELLMDAWRLAAPKGLVKAHETRSPRV